MSPLLGCPGPACVISARLFLRRCSTLPSGPWLGARAVPESLGSGGVAPPARKVWIRSRHSVMLNLARALPRLRVHDDSLLIRLGPGRRAEPPRRGTCPCLLPRGLRRVVVLSAKRGGGRVRGPVYHSVQEVCFGGPLEVHTGVCRCGEALGGVAGWGCSASQGPHARGGSRRSRVAQIRAPSLGCARAES